MNGFLHCFVPLFVAVDAIGCLPMFLGLTRDISDDRRRSVVVQSVITAAAVALAFLYGGPTLMQFLGVGIPDFMVAGGLMLLVLSLNDLLSGEKKHRLPDSESLGAVPLGIPLITGPAVLTTSLILSHSHGREVTAVALVINIVLAGVVFSFARPVSRFLGSAGTKTVSKIASLLLASIAVMLIRQGLMGVLAALPAARPV